MTPSKKMSALADRNTRNGTKNKLNLISQTFWYVDNDDMLTDVPLQHLSSIWQSAITKYFYAYVMEIWIWKAIHIQHTLTAPTAVVNAAPCSHVWWWVKYSIPSSQRLFMQCITCHLSEEAMTVKCLRSFKRYQTCATVCLLWNWSRWSGPLKRNTSGTSDAKSLLGCHQWLYGDWGVPTQ